MAFRNPGEPASRPFFFAALAALQNITTTSSTLLSVTAANKGGAAANVLVTDSTGNIGSLQIPPGDTRMLFGEPGVTFVGQLSVTPSAALDVTVVVI